MPMIANRFYHPAKTATAAIPVGVVVAESRRGKQVSKWRRAYSFIGGCLIGIAIAWPVFVLDAEENNGALPLFGSVILAGAGIGMHRRGAH